MSATTLTRGAAYAPPGTEGQRDWRTAAIALLSVRIIHGFIYWGGGSRRYIHAPSELDPNATTWMANKFQAAMPGALFGTDHMISFMLTHFYLLYGGVILFSATELIVGAMLMTGLLTRLAALMTMGLSVLLMAMFGWQGATCIDQWTMAAGNLAMGASLVLGGSGAYSLDNMLLERKPALVDRPWFRWMSGSLPLPLTDDGYRKLAFVLLTFVVIFNVGSYNYYRGSVLTPFHSGPVSPTKHHLMAAHPVLLPDGSGRFHVYAAARLTLPVPVSDATTSARYVQLTDVDGRTFSAPLSGKT
jgi:thiosulfate dehydrogenase (quinone)